MVDVPFREIVESLMWIANQTRPDIETYVDADYAHKAEDRRSVSGVAVCCGGTLLSCFSRTQKCVTLSTTEAEYVAMTDGVKEALYVRGVLAFLIPSLGAMSIGVYEDNKGAIDLANSTPTSRRVLSVFYWVLL